MTVIKNLLLVPLNILLAVLIAVGPFAIGQTAQSSPALVAESDSQRAIGSMSLPNLDPNGPTGDVQIEVKEVDAADAEAELAQALRNVDDTDTLVVSSDEDAFLAQTVEDSKSKPFGQVHILPLGKAIKASADIVGGANQLLRRSGHYLFDTAKNDKIGFAIATFTLSNEIVRWIHVTTASNFVITSNIIYTTLWSTLFLNKDTWSRATRPIQRTYRTLFGMSAVIPENPTASDTAIKFLSGLTLSLTLNTGRAALISIDQLTRNTFEPLNLAMPFIMGTVMTAAGFSWSELMGSIDETEHPRAKKIMRFVMNSRSCMISYFAASAMLMNPAEYGIAPWIAVAISGTTGLVLYSNAKKFVPLLNGTPRRARTCSELFAGA